MPYALMYVIYCFKINFQNKNSAFLCFDKKNLNGYTRALHLYIVDKSYIWGTSQHNIFNILFSLSSEHLSSATKVMILSGDGSVFQAWMIMPCGLFHAYMILPRLLWISVCVMQTWYRLVYTWWRLCFMLTWYFLVYLWCRYVSCIHDTASSNNDGAVFHAYMILPHL